MRQSEWQMQVFIVSDTFNLKRNQTVKAKQIDTYANFIN